MKKIKLFILLILVSSNLLAQNEIWGTVTNTGEYGYGYIFKTDSIGNNIQIVHQFDNVNGRFPGAIMQASNGKLYGMTGRGGQGELTVNHKGGVLYEYDPAIDSFRVLVHFSQNNSVFPYDGPKYLQGLTEGTPGILYGSVAFGGIQNGYVFSYNILTNTLSNIVSIPTFQGGAMNTTQGNRLNGPLFLATDGYFYSSTERYSQCPIPQPDAGCIIRINPVNNTFSYSYINPCSGTDGYHYYSNFIEEGGSLWSVAESGGLANKGVIYKYTPSNNTYIKKHDFQGGALGESPIPTMVKAGNGKFYGVAAGGISETYLPQGGGILYEIDPVSGIYAQKINFTLSNGWIGNVGPFPFHLISSQNGKLYGATRNGVFEYNIQTNSTRAASRFYPIGGAGQVETVRVVEICKFPTYAFSSNVNFTVCNGSDFTYDLESDNTTSVVWKHNGNIDPLQTSTTLSLMNISANDTGNWTAELSNACGTTITQVIQINLVPAVNVTQNNNSLEVTSGGDNFQWIDCAIQMPIAGEINSVFTPIESGLYAVEITNGLCIDTSGCYSVLILSVNENQANNAFKLYPNPVNDILYLEGNAQIQSIIIYDVLGQIVLNGEGKGERQINVSKLIKGIYFISIQTGNRLWKTKFLKE